MQETLYQTADARVSLLDSGCMRLYNTVDAGDTLSDSGCRRLSIRQRMQETLSRQRMQETLYQTGNAGDTLSDRGCMRVSIRQRIQETLYQTAASGVSLSDNLLNLLSDREISASAV